MRQSGQRGNQRRKYQRHGYQQRGYRQRATWTAALSLLPSLLLPSLLLPSLLLLFLLGVFAFVGCGRDERPQVVIYVAVDRGHAEPILKRFEQRTGVRVLAVYDAEAAKTTGLVSRLLAESAKPRCDVFWNNEVVQSMLLRREGLLETYRPPGGSEVPERFRDPEGYWTGVGGRYRVLVYNRRRLKDEQVPRSILELAEPRWQGRFAMADPQFGTTRTHVAALFAALGPDEARRFLERLRENQVRMTGGNAMVKNLVARAGEEPGAVVVGMTDTDDVRSGQADGDPLGMVFPDQDGMGTLLLPTTVCLVRGAPHPEAARRLVDFLVSAEAETMLTSDQSGYTPLRHIGPAGDAVEARDAVEAGDAVGAGNGETMTDRQPASSVPFPRTLDVSYDQILDHLEPSSRWSAEHFHP